MLILTRREGEIIHIGDNIQITVLGIKRGQVRIGVAAPRGMAVHRDEVKARIEAGIEPTTALRKAAFGQSRTPSAIKSTLGREGIRTGRPKGSPVGTPRIWSADQVEFVRSAYRTDTIELVTVRLNHEFATSFTVNQVRSLVTNRAIKSGRSGRFYPGQARTPGSGAKGPNRTSFKPGRPAHESRNYLPIGSTRISKDGYIERKVTDDPTIYPARRWVAEHRLVWEREVGPIPPGHIVVSRSGRHSTDVTQITPDTLECISKAENMRRNTVHNYPQPIVQVVQLRGTLIRTINQRRKKHARKQQHA